MKLTIGFSTCPNDTFIFDALVNGKIDTDGLEFELSLDDVETLNQKALNTELDITKLSYHAYAYVAEQYVLLDAGSALGFGVGPLLITNNTTLLDNDRYKAMHKQGAKLTNIVKFMAQYINPLHIGIPGKLTTANLLLSIAFPEATHKTEMVFSDIETKLLNNEIDLGVIIHENRFTYEQKGLYKLLDFGEYWESLTGCPIPLGGICVNRNLPKDVQLKVNNLVRKSVEYAFKHPQESLEFVRKYAQEMDDAVIIQHISTYVNKYSLNLGAEGRKSIKTLLNMSAEQNIYTPTSKDIFITP
jgi:1,4-dihydroxy-6-naphthoate synthase